MYKQIRQEARDEKPIREFSCRAPFKKLDYPILRNTEIQYDNFPTTLQDGKELIYLTRMANRNSPDGFSCVVGKTTQKKPRARISYYKEMCETQKEDSAKTITALQDIVLSAGSMHTSILCASVLEITDTCNNDDTENKWINHLVNLGLDVLNIKGRNT
jgi:hypothetical protein